LKVASVNPLLLVRNGKDQPIISFKTSDLDGFLNKMKSLGIECGEIITYGEGVNGPYRDLVMYDPNGHLIEVNSYPDLCLPKFRGY
jgi:phosphoglycerol transferase MdoB-like AlkP superfamily enzyme